MHTYGTAILQAQIANVSNSLSFFVKDTVDALMKAKQPKSAELRDIYVRRICQAVCEAIGGFNFRNYFRYGRPFDDEGEEELVNMKNLPPPKHPIGLQRQMRTMAAAIGDLDTLQGLVTDPQALYQGDSHYLPSVLNAVVVTGNMEIVKWILNHPNLDITRKSRDPDVTGKYIRALDGALSIAARTAQTSLGLMIAESCLEVELRRGIASGRWIDEAIQSASAYGNKDLFLELLACRGRSQERWHSCMKMNGPAIESDMLFRETSRSLILHLLRKGAINPNQFGSHVPMHLAIESHRFDVAKLLLDYRANVDARDCGGLSYTALEYAINRSYPCLPSIQFLIEHGSDPLKIRSRQGARTTEVREFINKVIEFINDNIGSTLTKDNGRVFWQIERGGLLTDSWHMYERITRTLNDTPHDEKRKRTELDLLEQSMAVS